MRIPAPILLTLVLVALRLGAAEPVALPYAPPVRAKPIGSTFVDWESLSFRPSPVGLYCPILDDPTPALEKLEIHVTRLRPGMSSHSPHRHPWEEILLLKEGRLDVSINGTLQRAGPGSLIFLASNDAHNVTNVGESLATYYVVNFVTGRVRTVGDRPASEWAPPADLRSCVIDCDHLPASKTEIGYHANVLDSPTLTFMRFDSHLTTLGPGKSTAPRNRDPGDELFVVKSGTLEVTLNAVTRVLGAGSFYYVAPNDERTMKNTGSVPCTYQVFRITSEKTPKKA